MQPPVGAAGVVIEAMRDSSAVDADEAETVFRLQLAADGKPEVLQQALEYVIARLGAAPEDPVFLEACQRLERALSCR